VLTVAQAANLELFRFASVKSDTLEQAAEIPTKVTVRKASTGR
jgi:hypothetical protein